MMILRLIVFLLISAGTALILHLSPESVGADIEELLYTPETLRHMTDRVKGKKGNRISQRYEKTKRALSELGKEKKFRLALCLSLGLGILGIVLAVTFENIYLAPVLGFTLAVIPFWYVSRRLGTYERQLNTELETALSVITSSYMLTDDLCEAVRENVRWLRSPAKGLFESFLFETEKVNPDIKKAIRNLEMRADDEIFKEWCETLVLCQDNPLFKETLPGVVSKLTDLRVINSEIETDMKKNRKEYFLMVILTLSNIPILYLLNTDWYAALMYTDIGKITLSVTALVIAVTMFLALKFTEPVKFGKRGRNGR